MPLTGQIPVYPFNPSDQLIIIIIVAVLLSPKISKCCPSLMTLQFLSDWY